MVQKNAPTLASDKPASVCRDLEPYESNDEFTASLSAVLEQDYGVQINDVDARQAADNINLFLETFL